MKGVFRWRWRFAVMGVSALTAFALSGPAPAAAFPVGGGGDGGTPTCTNASSGSLTATPSNILVGQSFVLSWSGLVSSLCTSIIITGPNGLNQQVAASGSMTLTPPPGTSTFTFRAVGTTGSSTLATKSVASLPAGAGTGTGTGAYNGPNPLAINTGMTGTSQYYMTDPTIPGLSCGDYATNHIFTEVEQRVGQRQCPR